jgi:hypothetical protein
MLYRFMGDVPMVIADVVSVVNIPGAIASVVSAVPEEYLTDTTWRFLRGLATDPDPPLPQHSEDSNAEKSTDTDEEMTEYQILLEDMKGPLTNLKANLDSYNHGEPTDVDWKRVFGKDKTTTRGQSGPNYTINLITTLLDQLGGRFNDVTTKSQQDIYVLHQNASEVRKSNRR